VQVETLSAASAENPASTAALPATTPAASEASAGVSDVPAVTAPLQPAASAAVSPAAPDAPESGHFFIQVGAYGQAENARRTAQKLRDAGLAHVFTLAPSADQLLQRVRIGPISSVQEFDRLIARLSALGFPGARLAQD